MSNALFLRNYLIIVGLILAVGWGLDRVLLHYNKQDNLATDSQYLRGSFLYINTVLENDQSAVRNSWQHYKAEFEHELGYPVALYERSDFSGDQNFLDQLETGHILALTNENNAMVYYRQINVSDYVIALGPILTSDSWQYNDMVLIAVYHVFVAVALFFWLRPFSSDLHELRSAASRFGENDFSTRVNVNQSSSIRPVADAFNAMAQRIEELVSAHKDLTQAVSHELKTPLARFKFSLEIISNLSDSKQRMSYIEAMKEDVRELDELIAEMLSYAEFGAHHLKLNLEVFHAGDWLRECVKHYAQEAKISNIELDINIEHPDQTIRIDKHLMSRALHNLIRNALRYAHQHIQISLHFAEQQTTLRVDDDGPGIPEQFREQVFQPFTRLDGSRDRQSGGHGLGLAITRRIVHQHGGSIQVGASSTGGAGFQLHWPG
ncbi:MAG: HAMP domain-containing protein [Gammaproteobacteria bacterium]|nr:HAMP domain-containing protein [Gammaproteobacteria bacterium]